VDSILSNNTRIEAAYAKLSAQLGHPAVGGAAFDDVGAQFSVLDDVEDGGDIRPRQQRGANEEARLLAEAANGSHVSPARQALLLKAFVDELSQLHRSACRLKVSRFDAVWLCIGAARV
jgi:hypothetical protein